MKRPGPLPYPKEQKKQVVAIRLLPKVIREINKLTENRSGFIESAILEKIERDIHLDSGRVIKQHVAVES
jgi:hypothetical protein